MSDQYENHQYEVPVARNCGGKSGKYIAQQKLFYPPWKQ